MDFKKQAAPREQLLSLVVLVSLFIMFFRVLYFPKREHAQQFKSQIQNLKLEKESLEKFTQALLKVVPQNRTLQERPVSKKIKILKGELPPLAEETAPLLAHITSPQFLKGITVKSMSDIPPKLEKTYRKADFFVNLQGSFRNIISYIESIEQLPALVVIGNVALKAVDPKATQVDLELNGTLFKWEEKHGTQ